MNTHPPPDAKTAETISPIPDRLQKYTPQQINDALDRLTADLAQANAFDKLRLITAENRAYLLTPREAQAILDHIRRLESFRKGTAAAPDLAAVETVRTQTPAAIKDPPYYTAEIAAFLNTLAQRGIDMDGDEPAELLYDHFGGSLPKLSAARAVRWWRANREAAPA